ncbi:MAG TPA: prepilin-type N-terminal cleavage/methylation domain-containing protein [Verrucomicrobiae bacterium]|jgi:prepilin-type N-terminal cleavage/methylation domain-containing protein
MNLPSANFQAWRTVKIPSAGRRGFTLIELMVALMIFSMVVACIYATLMLIMKSAQVGQSVSEKAQRQRIVMGTIEDALMCVQSFQSSQRYYSFNVTNGSNPSLSFAAYLPDGFPRSRKFQNIKVRRLQFSLEPGDNQRNNLVLRQNPILMDLDDDEAKYPLVLAKNVKAFSIECWDTNQVAWDTEWVSTNTLPPMVRIGIILGDDNANNSYNNYDNAQDQVISRAFSLPSTMMPTIVQMGGAANPFGGAPH